MLRAMPLATLVRAGLARQRAHLRRITRQLADLTPLQRERLRGIMRERYEQFSPVERERYRQGPYGRR